MVLLLDRFDRLLYFLEGYLEGPKPTEGLPHIRCMHLDEPHGSRKTFVCLRSVAKLPAYGMNSWQFKDTCVPAAH